MKHKFTRKYLIASLPAALCLPGAALGQAEGATAAPPSGIAPPEAQDTNTGIADIIVTAQKREQNLQDVPVSISAVNAETITANRIQDVTDLSRLAPNFTVRENSGGSKAPTYTMRGIVTAGTAPGSDKGVALYLDGVYVQSVQGSVFEFADIERIEVLRGPQGTLFGRNVTGGAVSFITRDPSGEFGVRQELAYGNLGQRRSKTRVDLPQIGPFSVTASYLHSEREGDLRNLGAGTRWDHSFATNGALGTYASPKRLGNQNVEGVFVSVKADLHPDLSLKYKFDYSQNNYTAPGVGVSYLPGAAALAFGGIAPAQPSGASAAPFPIARARYLEQDPALRTPITKKRPDAVNNAFTQPGRTAAYGHNFTARLEISDRVAVKNILSFRRSKQRSLGYQLDGLGGLRGQSAGGQGGVPALPANGFFGPFGAPVSAAAAFPILLVGNNGASTEKQWSNEFQVNYDSAFVTLTAGFLHFENRQTTGGFLDEFNVIQFAPIVGQGTSAAGTPFVLPRNTGFTLAQTRTKSDAVFIQPEVHVSEQLDIVGGVRVTRDRKSGFEPVPGAAFPYGPSLGRSSRIAYNDTRTTYLLGANFRLNDDLLLYAKYATGYISGGQLATISYDAETAKSFEVGVKADLFDRRLRSNLSLFHVKYGGIQQVTLGSLVGVASATNFSQALISSADATSKGFEWENTIAPLDGLTLRANVGYTDFKFDDATVFPGLAFNAGAPGFQEFNRPNWTLNNSIQYQTPKVIAGGRMVFRTDATYKSKSIGSADITPGNGPSALVDPAYRESVTVPANWIVNGRIGLEGFDVGGSKATFAVFGKNIFDNRDVNGVVGLGFATAVTYERSRTFGVDFTIEY